MASGTFKDKRPVRADRLLAGLGYGSRKAVAAAMRGGAFTIDGEPVRDPAAKIDPEALRTGTANACFEGAALEPLTPLTVLLHKPAGYICSHDDAGPLVFDLLPPRWRFRKPPLSLAGRLDGDSTGLVILSDDGAFVHRLIAPSSDTRKTYHVTLEKPLSGTEAALFASGTLMLKSEKKPLLPVEMTVLGEREARLVLREGRYHQIRRMFAATGNKVTALHRERIGPYSIDDIAEGDYSIAADEKSFAGMS